MLKTAVIILSVFFCLTVSVQAQSDAHSRVEFFGGFSVLRTNYEVQLPDPPAPTFVAFDGKQTFNGLNISGTGYLNKGFGLTGDFSLHFKSNKLADPLGGNITTDTRVMSITGGPQYKFHNSSRVTPFVHVLGGVAITTSKISVPSLSTSGTSSSTDLTVVTGGGIDVKVSKRIDLRIFQADYAPVFLRAGNDLGFGNSRADNFRFSFGIVFKH